MVTLQEEKAEQDRLLTHLIIPVQEWPKLGGMSSKQSQTCFGNSIPRQLSWRIDGRAGKFVDIRGVFPILTEDEQTEW